MHTSSSTIVRRIERLEGILGVRLFDRLPNGLALTRDGSSVFGAAKEMERASLSLRSGLDHQPNRKAVVRCAVTEGLGTFWLVPHLAEFSRTHPTTIVELMTSTHSPDVLRMEADVVIQLTWPNRPDQKVTRLGCMHIYPFASPRYERLYGLPKSLDEMARGHRLLDQTGPQLDLSTWPRMLGLDHLDGIAILRTNSSAAHFYAVELGIGIGALPTYALALGAELLAVDIGFKHRMDIWMTYHPDVKNVARVASFIDWVRSVFDTRRYPWFGDEFIHPNELMKTETLARVDLDSLRPVVAGPSDHMPPDRPRMRAGKR